MHRTGTRRSLWAITAYFDPFSTGHRLRVYREFRRRLAVPLVAVELAFGDEFHLRPDDADLVIHVRGGSVLWQKERLLNVALSALPPHVELVAWLDCDVVFLRHDWPEALARCLQDFHIVQPFRRFFYQPQHGSLDPASVPPEMTFEPAAFRFAQGRLPEEAFRMPGKSRELRYVPGGAWAARRSMLETHGFYDTGVLGGGDKLMFLAAADRYAAVGRWMSPAHQRHFSRWAKSFANSVQRKISYIEGDLVHLWHGNVASRRYYERIAGFEQFAFNPDVDLACTREGVWRWNSHKPEMHAFVRRQLALITPHSPPITGLGDDADRRTQPDSLSSAAVQS